ncbi:aspartyl-tRNA(Asn)/glutamyl-tRNA(Gln) amidotransferase subunit A [Faunimonas pinastri]|uniref:Indoleacetamide hydrolase n=1 Tax=Faunimonas pinastri TaxID=1855383 RepID=A0A1H9E5E1_9HYPH|nr:amidase [Faunimonas pinastri]SEQ20845.1 aspartyl-tRNA(Asn)/glutamyl-tRNA(Gln) amidotransferase subunit A [Faunimonas pinastri]
MAATKPLHELSIAEAGAALRAGDVTSKELTEHALSRIADLDPVLHAFVLVTGERALDDAGRADSELGQGIDKGPMHGIPYGLKDIYDTAGIRTTGHSKLLIENIPASDSVVAGKLKAGGGVLLGKLGTFEFAIGGPSHDLPFPPAKNPWNVEHFTGGSSSGSGSAVAAGMCRMAMGSDTGGSIRGPAFYCGTVGIKPTYGRVSRRGVFPLSYTLDHCGPLTWSVEDAALTMQVIAGYDPLDPASADVPVPDFTTGLGQDLKGLRIAFPRSFYVNAPEATAEVVASIDAAVQTIAQLGADVVEIDLPAFDLFNACGRVILTAEAYAIHEKDLKTRPLDYGRYTYQRFAPGAVLSAADLVQAFRLRKELTAVVNDQILGTHDAIITATGLATAARFDSFGRDATRWAGMQTIPFNVTGNPAMALPTGLSPASGLPLGMQIVGRPFDEPTVFRIGAAYEAAAKAIPAHPRLDMKLAS